MQLLSAQTVADRLDVSRKTVYAWMASGALPSVKYGRLRRVRLADLEAFGERWSNDGGPSDTAANGPQPSDVATASAESRLARVTARERSRSVEG